MGKDYQLLRIPHGQQPQQHRIDQAENGGVRPDAERKRENRNGCKARIPGQHTQAVTKVLNDRLDHRQPPLLPVDFLCLFDTAKAAHRRITRFFRRHSFAHILRHEHLQMRTQLIVQLLFQPPLPEQCYKACSQHSQPGHHSSLVIHTEAPPSDRLSQPFWRGDNLPALRFPTSEAT